MTTKPPPTTNGKLSDSARHVVLPSGITSTGWPAVRDKCRGFGIEFDPWQDGAGRVILAKRADGSYACSIGGVVMSVPRQAGKTFLIGAIVFALCLLHPNLTVLWTAHRLRTADETFAKMQAFARRKKVAPHVRKVWLGSGDQEIAFHNGSRILFGARERGFGRGFDDVDVEVFDEAQILTENAIDDMLPAMNTAANPLPIFVGTPPKPSDPSEVFATRREEALSGEFDDGAYIEFSADEGCSPVDRKQWKKANPSYPSRTPESAMLRLKKLLTPESYMREALGVWESEPESTVIPDWDSLTDTTSTIETGHAWALAVSPVEMGPQWASLGIAGRRADGRFHVEWLEHRSGTNWVVERCAEAFTSNGGIPLRVHKTGPEGALISHLVEAGVEVVEVTSSDVAHATGSFIAAATCAQPPVGNEPRVEPGLHHLGQPSLNKAVRNAVLRTGSEGAATWSQMKSTIEITPLKAVTVALGGVAEPAASRSAYEDNDLMTI